MATFVGNLYVCFGRHNLQYIQLFAAVTALQYYCLRYYGLTVLYNCLTYYQHNVLTVILRLLHFCILLILLLYCLKANKLFMRTGPGVKPARGPFQPGNKPKLTPARASAAAAASTK